MKQCLAVICLLLIVSSPASTLAAAISTGVGGTGRTSGQTPSVSTLSGSSTGANTAAGTATLTSGTSGLIVSPRDVSSQSNSSSPRALAPAQPSYTFLPGSSSQDVTGGSASASDGSVYVVGYSAGSGQTGSDYVVGVTGGFLAKYTSSGSLAWLERWSNAAYGRPSVATNGGYVYVASSAVKTVGQHTSVVVVVTEFDSSGSLKWEATWNVTGTDAPYGMAVSPGTGKVFVVADSLDIFGVPYQAYLLTFSAAGQFVAQEPFPTCQQFVTGPQGNLCPEAGLSSVAVRYYNLHDLVYVTGALGGYVNGVGQLSPVVGLYQDGTTLEWVNIFDFPSYAAATTQISVGGDGSLIVVGSVFEPYGDVLQDLFGVAADTIFSAAGAVCVLGTGGLCAVVAGAQIVYDLPNLNSEVLDILGALPHLGPVTDVISLFWDYQGLTQDLTQTPHPFVAKMDSNGTLLWSTTIQNDNKHQAGMGIAAALIPPNSGGGLYLAATASEKGGIAPGLANGTVIAWIGSGGAIISQAAFGSTGTGFTDKVSSLGLASGGTIEVVGVASGIPNAFYATNATVDSTLPTGLGPQLPSAYINSMYKFDGFHYLVNAPPSGAANFPVVGLGLSAIVVNPPKGSSGAYLELVNKPVTVNFISNPSTGATFLQNGFPGDVINSLNVFPGSSVNVAAGPGGTGPIQAAGGVFDKWTGPSGVSFVCATCSQTYVNISSTSSVTVTAVFGFPIYVGFLHGSSECISLSPIPDVPFYGDCSTNSMEAYYPLNAVVNECVTQSTSSYEFLLIGVGYVTSNPTSSSPPTCVKFSVPAAIGGGSTWVAQVLNLSPPSNPITFSETGLPSSPSGATWTVDLTAYVASLNGKQVAANYIQTSGVSSQIVYTGFGQTTYSWTAPSVTLNGCVFTPAPALGVYDSSKSPSSQKIAYSTNCVSQPVKLTSSAGQPSGTTLALAGCGVYPATVPGDGQTHTVIASPNCNLSVGLSVANSRALFPGGVSTWSFTTCASGTCPSRTNTYYYQVTNTFGINSEPSTGAFVAGLTGVFTGTYGGATPSVICTSPSSTKGATNQYCNGYSDYNTHVYAPWFLTGAASYTQWQEANGKLKDLGALTTGGGGYGGNYYYQVTNTFGINSEPSTGAFVAGLTGVFTGTYLGIASSTVCTTPVTTSGATNKACNGYSDYNTHAYGPQFLTGAASYTRWQEANGKVKDFGLLTNGGGSYGGNYYLQLQNTYQASPSPAKWDKAYGIPVSGTQLGVPGTICNIPAAANGGIVGCTGWSDYDLLVTVQNPISGSNWFAQNSNTFTDTSGGNTHTTNYAVAAVVSQPITLTVSEAGAPKSSIFSLSGCNISPTTIVGDGSSHTVAASANCLIKITAPAVANNVEILFPKSAAFVTFTTCLSGMCGPQSFSYYYLLQNTYAAVPLSPSTWDGNYGWQATGTVGGVTGQVVCSTTTSTGGGASNCPGFADYGTTVTLPSNIGSWLAQGHVSFTDITGGNTHPVSYSYSAPPQSTSIDLQASSYAINAGSSTTLKADLTANGQGVLSKTINFYLGPIGSGALIGSATTGAGGWATLTYSPPTGTDNLYSTFAGDASYQASASNAITINIFDFSVSLNPSSGSVVRGSNLYPTVTANLIGGTSASVLFSASGLPTGASASFAPSSCNPGCSVTMTISTLSTTATGVYSVTVTGTSGTLVHSATFTLTVTATLIPTSIDLIAPGAGTVGTPITLQAQLTDNQGQPVSGKTIYFYQNSAQIGSATTSSGTARLTFTPSSPGTFTFYSQFNGDLTYAGSTSNTATIVVSAAFSFSISVTPSVTITQGGIGSVAATLTLLSGTTTPVSFSFSGQPSGVTLSAPSCSPSCSSTVSITVGASVPVGSYPITVTGTGGGDSQPASFTLTVTSPLIPTSIDLIAPGAGTVGTPITLQAQLTDNQGQPVSGKTIYFYQNSALLGSATTSGGTARLSFTPSSPGTFTYYSQFNGDSSYASSISNTDTIVISSPFDFSISVTPSVTIAQGGIGSVTATLTLLSGSTTSVSVTPSGQPSGVTIGSASCFPSCSGSLSINVGSSVATGAYTVTVSGSGGGANHATSFTLTVTATLIPTSIDLIAPGAGTVGTPITLQAQLTDNQGQPVSGKTIYFYQNSALLGSATTSGGTARLTFTPSSPGTFTFYSQFNGDSSYASSISNTDTIVISSPFGFSISLTPSVSITQGSGGSVTATLTLLSGTTTPVSFSFSGQPSGVTLSAPSCSPSCSSTVSITVGASVPVGSYPITVTGTGGGDSQPASFTLTVTAAGFEVTFSESGLPGGAVWCVNLGALPQGCSGGTAVAFSGVAAGSYPFSVTYPGCGSGCQYSPSPSSGVVTVTGDTGQGVTFTMQYLLTMTTSGCCGAVSPATAWFNAGSVVTITATPSPGCYSFLSWSGSGSGSYTGGSGTATVTMNGAISETARFNNAC